MSDPMTTGRPSSSAERQAASVSSSESRLWRAELYGSRCSATAVTSYERACEPVHVPRAVELEPRAPTIALELEPLRSRCGAGAEHRSRIVPSDPWIQKGLWGLVVAAQPTPRHGARAVLVVDRRHAPTAPCSRPADSVCGTPAPAGCGSSSSQQRVMSNQCTDSRAETTETGADGDVTRHRTRARARRAHAAPAGRTRRRDERAAREGRGGRDNGRLGVRRNGRSDLIR